MQMKKLLIPVTAFASLASIPSTSATTFFPQDFTCPIGGEKFTTQVVGSSSSWGARPDGKRYGTLPVYPITECPENGFLLFKEEFTDKELATLEPAVLSEEYQAMREGETPYRRMWWLRSKIGASPESLAGNLLIAGWETDADPNRKARYQRDFIKAAQALVMTDESRQDWFWLNLRRANALRELGRFEEAKKAVNTLRKMNFPEDPEEQEWVAEILSGLETLSNEANAASEPTNLIPPRQAIFRCVKSESQLSDSEMKACNGTDILSEIADTTFKTDSGEQLNGKAAVQAMVRKWAL